MNIFEWVVTCLGMTGFVICCVLVWHAYFWIDKFEREHGINTKEKTNSWISRMMRTGSLFWLAGTISNRRLHNFIRMQCKKDDGFRYLVLSPEELYPLRLRSWIFFFGAIAFFLAGILAKIFFIN